MSSCQPVPTQFSLRLLIATKTPDLNVTGPVILVQGHAGVLIHGVNVKVGGGHANLLITLSSQFKCVSQCGGTNGAKFSVCSYAEGLQVEWTLGQGSNGHGNQVAWGCN